METLDNSLENLGNQWPLQPSRVDFILSMNRALLCEVAPTLRAAKTIHLYFYYDGKVSEEDRESAECIATEVISDFPDYDLKVEILQWDYPKPIPQEEGTTIYRRREADPKNPSKF